MSCKTSGFALSLACAASLLAASASYAALDDDFNQALDRMLMGMKTGAVSQMSETEKKELVACVQTVFADIPDEKKQTIVQASSETEVRQRFDEIGMENGGALKQQVRDECS